MKKLLCLLSLLLTVGPTDCLGNPTANDYVYKKEMYSINELHEFIDELYLNTDIPTTTIEFNNEDTIKLDKYQFSVICSKEESESENLPSDINEITLIAYFKDVNNKFTVRIAYNARKPVKPLKDNLEFEQTMLDNIVLYSIVNKNYGNVNFDIEITFTEKIDLELSEEIKNIVISNIKLYEKSV